MILRQFKFYSADGSGGGAGGTSEGQAPGGQSGEVTQQQQTQNTQDVASLPDWAQKVIRDTRAEAAEHRTKAKDRDTLAQRIQEIEDAKLSDIDKATKAAKEVTEKLTARETELREIRTERAVEKEAVKLKFVDGEAALALIAKKIEYDAEGNPSNVTALLEQLAKDKPFLVAEPQRQSGGGSSVTNPPRGGGAQTQTFSRSQIAGMSSDEYEKNRSAIMDATKDGRITE